MRTIWILCSTCLIIGCFQLPIGYYTFLRIMVTLGAVTIVLNEVKNDVNLIGIAFIGIAILFNPLIPIYFNNKNT